MPFRGLSYANGNARLLVGWLVALHTSSLAALMSPRGAGVDFIGGMAVVLLLSGLDDSS